MLIVGQASLLTRRNTYRALSNVRFRTPTTMEFPLLDVTLNRAPASATACWTCLEFLSFTCCGVAVANKTRVRAVESTADVDEPPFPAPKSCIIRVDIPDRGYSNVARGYPRWSAIEYGRKQNATSSPDILTVYVRTVLSTGTLRCRRVNCIPRRHAV